MISDSFHEQQRKSMVCEFGGSDGQIMYSKIEKAARQAQRLDARDPPRVQKTSQAKQRMKIS